MRNLYHLTIAQAAELLRRGEIKCVDLIEAFIARSDAVDGVIHSYITRRDEYARRSAERVDADIAAGRYMGILHGIPYGLKDNMDVAGVRTTCASRLMIDYIPNQDATVHERLRNAGAILLGKLNLLEYGTGLGAVSIDSLFPPAHNPWNTDYFTGGSSTGPGAAVAAGTVMAALGSDTSGSIRLPAAACGLVGVKPTYGRVSRAGIQPNCWTLDSVGPLTWTVEDAALVLQVIAGGDPRDPSTVGHPGVDFSRDLLKGVAGARIAVVRRFHQRDVEAEPDIVSAFENALSAFEELGATLIETDIDASMQQFRACGRIINAAESLSIHEKDFYDRHGDMGWPLKEKLMSGLVIRAVDYLRAMRWRRELAEMVDRALSPFDALICCGTTIAPPRLADTDSIVKFSAVSAMSVFSVSGHPALSICNGFTSSGLPLNMQIASGYWNESTLLRVAAAYERASPWRARRPLDE